MFDFKPQPMQRVELVLFKEDAPQAALLLANYGSFDPEFSEAAPEQLPELPGELYQQAYSETRAHLDKILSHYEIAAPEVIATPMQPVSPAQLAEISIWLKEVWQQCSEGQERARELIEDQRHTVQLLKALDQFMDISVDLALLQKKSALLDIRVGTLPRANIQRFEDALGLAGYAAIRFFTNPEQVHLIIAGAAVQAREIERVLQAAGWHTTEIPAEFHGHPIEVRKELTRRMAHLDERRRQESEQRLAELSQSNLRGRLLDAAHTLARAAPYGELAALMRGRGSLSTVNGWVPESQLPHLRRMLTENFGNRFVLHTRNPRADEHLRVPSFIIHHRWLRPFANLVLNYGVPRYGEIDPTVPFAVSFVLMFGMMFGDAGQGACIALAGILLRRRLGQYAPLAVAAGTSSTLFGLLYGSVFGFEHILPALWMAPLSDPLLMLGVALGWGAGFILLSTVLTIRNRIADGRMREALLDSHGAAGLLLYLGLLSGAWRFTTTGEPGIATMLMVCTGLAAILIHVWQKNPGTATAERILIALMEGFESVMAYISNTLSFLRLAAFSLNHVALSIAVFTVASMMHTTGYWLTVVLGNLSILVLEGAIVAIQTLRLEYYEGFSRFFGGDGRPFRPLTLGKQKGFREPLEIHFAG
jgi:V/A-type H+-transporting ATPase subunit I